jgi:hypothetical protein
MTPALDAMTTPMIYEYRVAEERPRRRLDPSIQVSGTWEIEPIRAVLHLQSLAHGWDRAGSPPPGEKAVELAIEIISCAARLGYDDIGAPHVFPVPGGGVQLEWLQGDRRLEVEVLPDGAAQFLTVKDGDPLKEGEYPLWPPTEAKTLFSWLISRM